ncbi:MAG TPA: 3-phosphoshikimate 1-carboxyvinyltransferase, partial [Flavobacterium sp.]|nr:3-phosphoshikimate 1-carboxyvinyltransferase [Flavobacterium sp.]
MNLLLKSEILNLTRAAANWRSKSKIKITGSKSETNRLLLLQALFPNISLENTSNSDDSEVMQKALASNSQIPTPNSLLIDIHHAGTAMRFLTAYFAVNEGREVVLTGSTRMKERTIKVLVEALQQLGANISYENQEGYPPIRINGQKITKNQVSIPANVSSQYISALLLVAPKLENGLELTL